MYTLEQEKLGLHLFYEKRYLQADIKEGRPNPCLHAFYYYKIENEVTHEEKRTVLGEELVISDLTKKREEYVIQRHKLVIKRARLTDAEPDCDEIFDDNDNVLAEVSEHELEVALIAAAKSPLIDNRIRNIAQEIEERINNYKNK